MSMGNRHYYLLYFLRYLSVVYGKMVGISGAREGITITF